MGTGQIDTIINYKRRMFVIKSMNWRVWIQTCIICNWGWKVGNGFIYYLEIGSHHIPKMESFLFWELCLTTSVTLSYFRQISTFSKMRKSNFTPSHISAKTQFQCRSVQLSLINFHIKISPSGFFGASVSIFRLVKLVHILYLLMSLLQ